MRKHFLIEVKISWERDPYGEEALEWLRANKYRAEKDWMIDMHGGRTTYTSFWFKDSSKALLMKLTLGGL